MRISIPAAALALVAAALLAAPAFARPALTHQVDVTINNSSCTLQFTSVSKQNTTILFHVINNADTPRGFSIYGLRSGMVKPHQSSQFQLKFRGPGSYKYQCVSGVYPHPKVVKRGTFTIRKS